MTRFGLVQLAAFVAVSSAATPIVRAQTTVDFPLSIDNLPSYDRVDGLSLRFGPTITFGDEYDERLVVTPMLTYRSHLGKIDPSLFVVGQITSDSTIGVDVRASRGTFSNDGWIRSELINSVTSFGVGTDARNYFRADRGEARLTSALHLPIDVATIFAGVRSERDWSTGWRGGSDMGPFSLFSRSDTVNGIQRPNPAIDAGHITSVIAGGHAEYEGISGSGMLDILVEAAGKTEAGGSFRQVTVGGATRISTIRDEHIELSAHLVATGSDTFTPRQRYAYLGGAGSLSTIDLLSLGGDRLYYLDALYTIPIPALVIPILGSPYIAPHFAVGAAGVGGFGLPVQNVGARVGVEVFTVDYVVNPRTHKSAFGVGFALRP